MKANVKFGEGIIGHEVLLSIQDCIVLKSLLGELNEVKEYLDRRSSDQVHKTTIDKTINFIVRVSGDVMSLDEAAGEMFNPPLTEEEHRAFQHGGN